jgi:group I intron endonuclease
MYSLYGIYNKINGKIYIGITNNLKRRWYEHKKNSKKITEKSYAIHHAIAKYGSENFIFKYIQNTFDLATANFIEVEWIQLLKDSGYLLYNQTNGGDGTKGYSRVWTEDQKQKASAKYSGIGNPMYGVKLFGKANGNYGKPMMPHVKNELLNHRRKLTDSQIKEIIELYNTGEYTQAKLANQFNISPTQIHRIVKRKSWTNKSYDDVIVTNNIP